MPEMIVVARKDGRGGIKPFGKYGKKQAGAMVDMGGKKYKVTKDGRVNIPKKIMEKYGITGDNGRKRISINFSSTSGKKGWKQVAAVISEPDIASKDLKTGARPLIEHPETFEPTDELLPESDADYIWS